MVFTLHQKLAAEFVATMMFVFVGCGTIVATQALDTFYMSSGTMASFLIASAMAFGTAIAVLGYAVSPVSGAHMNPAVTASLLLIGEMDPMEAGAYIAAQVLGAVAGACLVWGCMADEYLRDMQDDAPPFLLGSNFVTENLPHGSAFVLEMMGTFMWVFTMLMAVVHKSSMAKNLGPIAVGWAVLLAHFFCMPFTGCGINPARSFGPHFVVILAGEKVGVDGWWVFYTAPFVGGGMAAMMYKFIFMEWDDTPTPAVEAAPAAEHEGSDGAKGEDPKEVDEEMHHA
eukprot:Nitzschia sp. Nitz4//scaffold317_size20466//10725//11912//NITZ4_008663-RA/size20466-processed-gene-0.9-mRNA-1//1//CDS//3329547536//1839//frame0